MGQVNYTLENLDSGLLIQYTDLIQSQRKISCNKLYKYTVQSWQLIDTKEKSEVLQKA